MAVKEDAAANGIPLLVRSIVLQKTLPTVKSLPLIETIVTIRLFFCSGYFISF